MFNTILTDSSLTIANALICTAVSLALGFVAAFVYMFKGTYTKSFVITLAILPVLVQVVIMMVNGNLGTGIAVLGAFSLIRFRSVAGSAKEISSVFFAMAIGLAVGMGYLTFAAVITVVVCAVMIVLNMTSFGNKPLDEKMLKITIPENLDYTEVFNDLFDRYLSSYTLENVKTTNLGTMYELRYSVKMKDAGKEKELIDELRCRNGNLTIICGRTQTVKEEL